MIRLAIQRPLLTVVMALLTVVMGIFTYSKIPADLLPQFNTPAVQIVTFYPGMPPEVMEKDIMSRLQRWTGQSIGIEHQEGTAMQGVCIVKDFFRDDISMDTAMAQVTSYAMSDMFYLPPGTIPPMIMPFDPTASVPLCLVVVSNPQMNEQELYDIAYYELRNKLQSIQGVIAPAVYGGKLRRILAYVEREKLEALGLSLMDVQRSLLKQNVLIPAGSIKIGDQDLQIFTNAIPEKIEELNYTPIKMSKNGQPVLMRDIGEVRNSSQIQTNIVRVNGQRQVYIPIYRQPGANTIEIVDQIKEQLQTILVRLKTERSEDPKMKDLVLSVNMDQSIGVRESISGLQLAALLGAVLAGGVVLLFLRNLRLTFIVVLAIPLAVLAAIFGLYFSGDTINAMTLGGLALAIGILVDQSIVVLENIVRHVRMGKTPPQAALDGTREVMIPILVSTITFAVVFFPVVFLSGLAKFLFTPLAIAASIAIVASYIISITLVPAYCSRVLKPISVAITDENQSHQRGLLSRSLDGLLTLRYPVLIGTCVLFAGSLWALQNMGQELFPPVDSGQMTLYVRLPSGTRIENTEATIQEIEQEIIKVIGQPDPAYALGASYEQHPDSNLQLLISNIGVLMDWPAAYTPNRGTMDAFMLVQLKRKQGGNFKDVFQYVEELRAKLNKQFPGVEIAFDTGGMMTAALNMGEPSPIHFQIQSSNLETAQDVARIIEDVARGVPGTADVRTAQRIDYPALQVEMNRELAARQGITPDDVMKNLVAATNSTINFQPTFWIDKYKGNHYFFGVQYWEEDLNSEASLLNIPVSGEWDAPRRLGNVATISRTVQPAVVNHRNITRVTDVYANLLPGYDVGRVVTQIEKQLEQVPELGAELATDERGDFYRLNGPSGGVQKNPFEGVSFRMMGEVRSMRESFQQFTSGLIIASILVYLVMVAQFNNFLDPLIVLLTVPLGFIGIVGILLITQTHLSIMAFMGIIMTVGIVVEYSNVLVDFANRRLAEGMSVREAIIDATRIRLRPILMTSLTTWLALLPMAIGFGGGEANVPLARAIIGGVLGATVLSLVVVPCLYLVLKRQPPASATPQAAGLLEPLGA
ncbi:MAG: efflux RND transporter permease subunit [Pirellulaceae bacterium]